MNEEKLITEYNIAFNEIMSRILNKIKQGKYADIDKGLLMQIDRTLKQLEKTTLDYSEKEILKAYSKNRAATIEALSVILGKTAINTFSLVDERAVKEIQKIFSDTMLDGLTGTRKTIAQLVKKSVELNKLQQINPKVLAEKMADTLKESGIFTFQDSLGRTYNLVDYSKMAIRTAATRAVNQSVFNASQELDNDLVKMSHHSSSCPLCALYEGRVYSISGKSKEYPPLSAINKGSVIQYSTIHPSCRHRFTVYVEEFDNNSEQTRIDSNKPFVDSRSDYQRELYSKRQQQNVIKQRMRKNKDTVKAYESVGISNLSEEQKSEYKRLKLQNSMLRSKNKSIETWKQDKK